MLQADLADADACERLVAEADDALGGLTLLVNNAATFRRTPLDELEVADFDHFMQSNARSVYVLSLVAGRLFKSRGRGCIVNLADVAGLVALARVHPLQRQQGRRRQPHEGLREGARARGARERRGAGSRCCPRRASRPSRASRRSPRRC